MKVPPKKSRKGWRYPLKERKLGALIKVEGFELRCSLLLDSPVFLVCDADIMEDEVKKLLLRLDPNKACGPDGTTNRLLKTVEEEVMPALTLLHTAQGHVYQPGSWCTSLSSSKKVKKHGRGLSSHLPHLHSLQTNGTQHHQCHHITLEEEQHPLFLT